MRWLAWVAALAACSFDPGGGVVDDGTADGGLASDAVAKPSFDARPSIDALPGAPDAEPPDIDASTGCAGPCPADGDPCSSDDDCAPSSVCSDNPFESPGGYCVTVGCTVGDDSTCAPGGDGTCVDPDIFDGIPPICVDRCASTSECRAGDGYQCSPIGIGVSACLYSHADPGAGCSSDMQCGRAPWECVTEDGFPNGYCGAMGCTAAPDSCPEGAFCAMVGGETYCIEPCDSVIGDLDCRFLEGYECADFGSGFFGCIDLDELD